MILFLCDCARQLFHHNTEQGGEIPKNVFMVFEYLEYDLTGILDSPEIRFTQDHIKSWAQQLLSGVHYMHTNKGKQRHAPEDRSFPSFLFGWLTNTSRLGLIVIHRDLKASNLLINKKGELKIADWGLARSWNSEMKRLTNRVITLWYRPPELLLGYVNYTPKIDMWSVGCIIAEMFRRQGFLKGTNEPEQLDLIFKTCGTPTAENWPELPKRGRLWKNHEPGPGDARYRRRIREALKANLPNPKWMTENAIDLIDKLMTLDPEKRWSAEQALDAEYFFENPIVKPADKLSMKFSVSSMHEWDSKQKHAKLVALRKAQAAKEAGQTQTKRPPPPPPRK